MTRRQRARGDQGDQGGRQYLTRTLDNAGIRYGRRVFINKNFIFDYIKIYQVENRGQLFTAFFWGDLAKPGAVFLKKLEKTFENACNLARGF